jgi:flavodoxin
MKALIIYCSEYRKNTEKIARRMAEKAGCELMNIKEADNINTDNYSLIGFGSGVYRESLSPKLFRFVEDLNLKGKGVFVFSTSGVGMKFYNNRLIRLLESKGAKVKGSFACKGSFIPKEFTKSKIFNFMSKLSQGHPNDRDYEAAEEFIMRVL